jgi:hypothetical protein
MVLCSFRITSHSTTCTGLRTALSARLDAHHPWTFPPPLVLYTWADAWACCVSGYCGTSKYATHGAKGLQLLKVYNIDGYIYAMYAIYAMLSIYSIHGFHHTGLQPNALCAVSVFYCVILCFCLVNNVWQYWGARTSVIEELSLLHSVRKQAYCRTQI